MKITVLIENTAPEYLKCEHGLSIYIAYNEKCYLLDTGSSDIFMDNAEVLKTKLENVDAAFYRMDTMIIQEALRRSLRKTRAQKFTYRRVLKNFVTKM